MIIIKMQHLSLLNHKINWGEILQKFIFIEFFTYSEAQIFFDEFEYFEFE